MCSVRKPNKYNFIGHSDVYLSSAFVFIACLSVCLSVCLSGQVFVYTFLFLGVHLSVISAFCLYKIYL